MKLVYQLAAIGMGLFGLYCCFDIATQGQVQLTGVRAELAHTRSMLRQTACVLPVRKQPMPEIVIDVTLAQKNNNPLNVKRPANGGRWKGQVGTDRFGHTIFKTEEYGIRAGALVLLTYARKHKIATVEELVRRFAEGNHEGYIKNLCRRLGVSPTEKIDLVQRMPELLRAMVRQESGRDLPDHLFAPYDVVVKF